MNQFQKENPFSKILNTDRESNERQYSTSKFIFPSTPENSFEKTPSYTNKSTKNLFYQKNVNKRIAIEQPKYCHIKDRIFNARDKDDNNNEILLKRKKIYNTNVIKMGHIKFQNFLSGKFENFDVYKDTILNMGSLNDLLLVKTIEDEDVDTDDEGIENAEKFVINELGRAIDLMKGSK